MKPNELLDKLYNECISEITNVDDDALFAASILQAASGYVCGRLDHYTNCSTVANWLKFKDTGTCNDFAVTGRYFMEIKEEETRRGNQWKRNLKATGCLIGTMS